VHVTDTEDSMPTDKTTSLRAWFQKNGAA